MRTCLALATLCLGFMHGAARADADALVDGMSPKDVALGEALRGEAIGASSVSLNPAGLPLTQELVGEVGYGYRPSDGASLVGISACDSTPAVPGCFYYNYAAAEPEISGMAVRRRTHVFGVTLARAISRNILIGVGTKYFDFDTDVMGESNASGLSWDAGLTFRASNILNIGVAGYNIFGEKSPQFPRAFGGGVALHPLPSLRASFDVLFRTGLPDGAKSGRYGGGVEYFFASAAGQTGYPLRLGALHDRTEDKTYLSGGIGFATAKVGIDVAARRAVDDSDEVLIIGSLRLYGPRTAPTFATE